MWARNSSPGSLSDGAKSSSLGRGTIGEGPLQEGFNSPDNAVSENPAVTGAGELIPRVRLTELQSLAETSPQLASDVVAIVRERAETRSRVEKRQQYVQVLGAISALTVALSFGYWSFLLLQTGNIVGGSVLGTADLAALVTAFVASGRKR